MVREGYKQAEVGVIPEDWDDKKLGDFVSLQRGYDLTARERRTGNVPVMGAAGQNGCHDTALVQGPGIVLGRSGASFGQVHYCEKDYWPHNTGLYATDLHGNDPRFAFYFLDALDFSRYNSGGAQQSLNRNFIYPIPIAVPAVEEQRSIAQALSDVDALIAALDKAIAKKRHLKTATMQQLLTGKKRLPGFGEGKGYQQTEVGVIPEDWRVTQLKELIEPNRKITYGIVVPGSNIPNGIPMIRAQDYSRGWVDINELYRVATEIDNAYKRSKVIAGDILLTIVGSVGNLAKVPFIFSGSNLTQQTARLAFDKNVADADFYLSILCSNFGQREILNYTKSGVQPSLNLSDVDKFRVPYPSLPEQRAIATVLSDMDAEIAALETRLAKTQALKQGMMQALLTGRVRLV